MQLHARFRSLALLLVLPAFGVAMSCGGGGGDNGGGGNQPLTATFTAATANPGNGTIVLRPGTANGDSFQVKVSATGFPDMFGVTLRITYDSTKARLVQVDTTGSPIKAGTDASSYFEQILTSTGQVDITSTRLQNDAGTFPGVAITSTADLAVITFQARAATSGSPFTIIDPRRACDSTTANCTPPLTVTWSGGTLTAN